MGGRRLTTSIITGVLILGLLGAPASATPSSAVPAEPQGLVRPEAGDYEPGPERARLLHAIRQLQNLNAPPRLIQLLRAEEVFSETFMFPVPLHDLNGDGRQEVAEYEMTFSLSFDDTNGGLVAGEDAQTVLRVRDGRNGKRLWKKRWDDLVVIVPMKVGPKARNGLVTIKGFFNLFSTAAEEDFTLEGLDGRGKRVWLRSYPTITGGDYLASVRENVPVSIATFNGAKGKSDDILLGLGTEVSTLFAYTMITRAIVIDGRDGSENVHPTRDVGVNWYPYPSPAGDMDGDGLEDYVVINQPGVDPGGAQEPPSVGGTVYARASTDGGALWTTSGFTFYDFAWATTLPDVVFGSNRDIALVTPQDEHWSRFLVILLDGDVGYVRWTRFGHGASSPGDIDGDGDRDVQLSEADIHFKSQKAWFSERAVTGDGKPLWKKKVTWHYNPTLPCPEGVCFGGFGWGSSGAGDVQPDSINDRLAYLHVDQDPDFNESRSWLVSGRNGKVLLRSKAMVSPAGGAVDGHGADLLLTKVNDGTVSVKGLRGDNSDVLLDLRFRGPNELLPKSTFAFSTGMKATLDRCRDIMTVISENGGTYYAVVSGGSGRVMWSRWFGASGKAPRITARRDLNPGC